ncbi:MAG: HD domain-containing protein [Spirochaetaceae bacterium]|nr:HD domain-containing protein [Spirochaetaceae bacterium]
MITKGLNNELSSNVLEYRVKDRTEDVRSSYYRDMTAIIHSSAFRRLKHKTQVFFAPSNDHICTRMEHCLHVASIASTVCRGLNLDSELAWSIGMGHDLGHTPFGHLGESILSDLMVKDGFEPFEHEIHSLRVVDFLSRKGEGLNLTYAVRDGIVSHCGESIQQSLKPSFIVKDFSKIISKNGLIPSTYEATVVRFCDSIAYVGRDWEDACRLKLIDKNDLPDEVKSILGNENGRIIDTLVNDLILRSNSDCGISFSDEVYKALIIMKDYNYKNIYKSSMLNGYRKYFTRLLNLIADYLKSLYISYGTEYEGYESEKNMLALGFGSHLREMKCKYIELEGNSNRLIYDYIAGMSDNFALDCASEILIPEHLNEHLEASLTGKWFDAR